ncbi:MAG TPA: ankyrin repeat domain-containing protein [Bacteroidales bacterium]|nr:ankyrin repeat domain-containing protein [Bacteroidales bacterium]HRX95704.1 ankyrin repeat domain-containing protein [Bacteroidales bacterium]
MIIKHFKSGIFLVSFIALSISGCNPNYNNKNNNLNEDPDSVLSQPDSSSELQSADIVPNYDTCVFKLTSAIKRNDTAYIRNSILNGCNINQFLYEGDEDVLLRIAVYYCDTSMLRFMLENGADPNFHGKFRKSATHFAASIDSAKLKLMLDYGGDPNSYYIIYNRTPIISAIIEDKFGCVKLLVAQNISLNPDSSNHFTSALNAAITNENYKIIDYLLAHGADPNSRFSISESPDCFMCLDDVNILHVIAGAFSNFKEKDKMMQLLNRFVEMGTDINAESFYRQTPLEFATFSQDTALLSFFIDNGAKLEGAFNTASRWSKYISVEYLLKKGADPNARSFYGGTPLTNAIKCCGDGFGSGITYEERTKTIDLLLEYGADPDLKDEDDKSFNDYLKSGANMVYQHFIHDGRLSWDDLDFEPRGDVIKKVTVDSTEIAVYSKPYTLAPIVKTLKKGDVYFLRNGTWIINEELTGLTSKWVEIKGYDFSGYILENSKPTMQ